MAEFKYRLGGASTAYVIGRQDPAVHLDVFAHDDKGASVILHKSVIITKEQYAELVKAKDVKQELKSLILKSDPEFTVPVLLARQEAEAKLKAAQAEALEMASVVEGLIPAGTWLNHTVVAEPMEIG